MSTTKVPDIHTKEGMDELEKKLDGIDFGIPQDTYLNGPCIWPHDGRCT